MARRVITVTARIAFIVCGLDSLVVGFLYWMQHGEDLPVESEWIIFVIALAVVGGFSFVVALLPRSRIAKACKTERDDDQIFSVSLKLLGVFAAISYVIAIVGYFAPHTWSLNVQLMLSLCPLYFVKMLIDPSPVWIFLVLAPMNAAVYGSLGVLVGYARLAFWKQRTDIRR
jgi:hypothetical protein